ncbi:MAG: DUF3750 domain-containing protein [Pseudomonadota bacterium]
MTHASVRTPSKSPVSTGGNGMRGGFRRIGSMTIFVLLILFIIPALAHVAVWQLQDRPGSWRNADWSSAGILPRTLPREAAEIMVLDARTGGLKGALSVHSWIVVKVPGEVRYRRYDVVGWGPALRRDVYAPDARWYSNEPNIRHRVTGEDAARAIPELLAAIESYAYAGRGDYTIWPGPNSNSFVAEVLRAVPQLGFSTSPLGVGRDFARGPVLTLKNGMLRASLWGYAGFQVGLSSGIELNFLGLVTSINPNARLAALPGFGEFRLRQGGQNGTREPSSDTSS